MLNKLESLRGIAACLVVIYHSRFNYGDAPITFIHNSYLFVDLFFILSGFVMALAYSDKITNNFPFKTYLTLRLGRIYPLHAFMLFTWLIYLIALYLMGFSGTEQLTNPDYSFFSNLLLSQSMGLHDMTTWNEPSWSISTEFYAYIAFFWISTFFDKKKTLFVPLIVSVGCYLFLISLERNSLNIIYDFGFFRCLGAFYLGVFLYRLKKINLLNSWATNKINALEVISITFTVFSVSIAEQSPYFFIFPIMSFMLIIWVFSNDNNGQLGQLFNSLALRKIGQWSYSIYLLHWLICNVSGRFFEGVLGLDADASLGGYSLLINALLLLITIVLSKFSYQYIEMPSRDFSKIYAYRIKKKVISTI
ncbi:MAG: peptidoglycan/LPS O-acetylase OafA/YrhL [Colwellia sp.]|jgi:peptidoglycan/LPS O-acetylase OafA/YrhL